MNGPFSLDVFSQHYNPWADPDLIKQSGSDKSLHDLLVRRQVAHLSLLKYEATDARMDQVALLDTATDIYRQTYPPAPKEK